MDKVVKYQYFINYDISMTKLFVRLRNSQYIRDMKVINIPLTLNEVKNQSTLVGKLQVLYLIKNHSLYPYMMDMISKLVDMDMRGLHTQEDTLNYINDICDEFIHQFNNPPKVKQPDPDLPF